MDINNYYDEEYFMKGTKSGYGGKYQPYAKEYRLPQARKHILEFTVLNPKTILILGCARGYLVQAFRERGMQAYGIDISKWAIQNTDVEEQYKQYLILGDITKKLQWKKNMFDLVIAEDVLEHIQKEKLRKTIKEISRITSKYLYLVVPIIDNGVDKTHVSILPLEYWINIFKQNKMIMIKGTTVQQIDGITSFRALFKKLKR